MRESSLTLLFTFVHDPGYWQEELLIGTHTFHQNLVGHQIKVDVAQTESKLILKSMSKKNLSNFWQITLCRILDESLGDVFKLKSLIVDLRLCGRGFDENTHPRCSKDLLSHALTAAGFFWILIMSDDSLTADKSSSFHLVFDLHGNSQSWGCLCKKRKVG